MDNAVFDTGSDEFYMKSNSQNGFSLISVVVAGAIGTFIVAAMTTAIINMQNESRRLNETFDLSSTISELKALWANPSICEDSFNGLNIQFTGIYAPNTSSAKQTKSISSIDGNNINSFNSNRIVQLKNVDISLLSGDPAIRNFHARVDLKPYDKAGSLINYIRPKSLVLEIQLDPANNISSCTSSDRGLASTTASCKTSPSGGNSTHSHGTVIKGGIHDLGQNNTLTGTPHYKCINGQWLFAGTALQPNR